MRLYEMSGRRQKLLEPMMPKRLNIRQTMELAKSAGVLIGLAVDSTGRPDAAAAAQAQVARLTAEIQASMLSVEECQRVLRATCATILATLDEVPTGAEAGDGAGLTAAQYHHALEVAGISPDSVLGYGMCRDGSGWNIVVSMTARRYILTPDGKYLAS